MNLNAYNLPSVGLILYAHSPRIVLFVCNDLLASIYFVFEIVGDFSRARKLEEKETKTICMHTFKLAIWIGFNPHAT